MASIDLVRGYDSRAAARYTYYLRTVHYMHVHMYTYMCVFRYTYIRAIPQFFSSSTLRREPEINLLGNVKATNSQITIKIKLSGMTQLV